MKLFTLLMCLTLAGCGTKMQRAQQDYACRNDGGVYKYTNSIFFKANCRSGALIKVRASARLPDNFMPNRG